MNFLRSNILRRLKNKKAIYSLIIIICLLGVSTGIVYATTIVSCHGSSASASGHYQDCYKIFNRTSPATEVDEWGQCRNVTNHTAGGLSVFIPTNTSAEWQSVYAHASTLPSGLTLAICPPPSSCQTNYDGEAELYAADTSGQVVGLATGNTTGSNSSGYWNGILTGIPSSSPFYQFINNNFRQIDGVHWANASGNNGGGTKSGVTTVNGVTYTWQTVLEGPSEGANPSQLGWGAYLEVNSSDNSCTTGSGPFSATYTAPCGDDSNDVGLGKAENYAEANLINTINASSWPQAKKTAADALLNNGLQWQNQSTAHTGSANGYTFSYYTDFSFEDICNTGPYRYTADIDGFQ